MATPFRPLQHDSSSPLPSLDEILSKIKKPSQASNPLSASPSKFTTASSFVRPDPTPIDLTTPARAPSESIDPDDNVRIIKIPAPGQKRYRRKNGSGKLREWKPKTSKPPPADEDQEKPWRKYQLPEPKKPKTRGKAKKNTEEEIVRSRHVSREPKSVSPDPEPKRKRKKPEEPLELAPASRRRVEWTPPPSDKVITIGSKSSDAGVLCSPEAPPGKVFDTLLQDYGRPADEAPPESRAPSSGVLGKRNIVNVGSLGGPIMTANEAPAKKAPKKKKPRTITDLATAAYAPVEPAAEAETATVSLASHIEQQGDAEPRKGAKKTRAKKKTKEPEPEPVLLSPNAAIRQVDAQAYVFGTSSQLVLEDMPAPVSQMDRPLHKDFVYRDEDPFATPINSDAVEPEPKQKLWEVGARDEEGKVLDLPVINLVDSPDPGAMGLEINPFGYPSARTAPTTKAAATRVEQTGHDAVSHTTQLSSAPQILVEAQPQISTVPEFLCSPPDSNATQQPLAPKPRPEPPYTAPAKPKFDLYTDVQLAAEVAKYGFKSIKRRTAMIALLDQCWDSKAGARPPLSSLPSNRSISTTTVSSAKADSPKRARGRPKKAAAEPPEPPPSGQSAAASPKKPRGRPRKDTTAAKPKAAAPRTPTKRSKKAVIEIPDSDSEGLDSIPSSPEDLFSSPPGIDVTLSLDEHTEGPLDIGASDEESSLMVCITKAVRAAPATKDPSQPSWHEKMLMYEPVILEDLAAWLNTGPLDQAGYEGEVSPGQVKQWCESKSVCCLWRMNLSGKERKRY